jgi:hypothetical protein
MQGLEEENSSLHIVAETVLLFPFLIHMVTRTFLITFSSHLVALKKLIITSFSQPLVHHQLDSSPLCQSDLSHPTDCLLPALYNASKNAEPMHIHLEGGNCSIC